MFFNSTKLTLANTMMIGVIMTICSSNWISMWMGLEISLLSFIPFMNNKNNLSSESMMKYFIMQSVASSMFLFSVICMLIGVNITNEMIMTISMLIKLGSAPFHNWVLMIVESMNLLSMFSMLTIMSIPPLSIMFMINSKMLMIPVLMSMIMSSISCLNQSSVRKIIGYSSIYNVGLMLISTDKLKVMVLFVTIYSMMMFMLTFFMKKMKINFINQMMSNQFNIWLKISLWINMLSMAGFPLTIGFLAKLLIIQSLVHNSQFIMTLVFVLTSMLVLTFYSRLAFTSMLTFFSLKKWNTIKTKSFHWTMSANLTIFPLMISLTGTV